jgi:ADP-ribosyl-[dinitrogen reductase] hydrolase
MTVPLEKRIRGCLLGGAIGDALGAPIEFMSAAEIRRTFGPGGIGDYSEAYGRRGAITDDTQMTLFTAEGLLRGFVREVLRGLPPVIPSVVSHAYLRWLSTQGITPRVENLGKDGWIWTLPELHSRRAPGRTCLSALARLERFGDDRAANDSKGAGAIMRIAPVGLAMGRNAKDHAGLVFDHAVRISWITHGHPSGYLSAAAFAVVIHGLLLGDTLEQGIATARALVSEAQDSGETLAKIDQAMTLVAADTPPSEALPAIGQGWVGEEALGIAIYCAGVGRDFASAVRLAVNHDGDSDTTGSLVGQLLGARDGEDVLPQEWLRELELREAIAAIADDLAAFPTWDLHGDDDERIWERYPGW